MKYPEFIYKGFQGEYPREQCEKEYDRRRLALIEAAVPAALESNARVVAAAVSSGITFEVNEVDSANQVVEFVDHLLKRMYEG